MAEAKFTAGPWAMAVGDTTGFKTRSGNPGIYAEARPTDSFFVLKIAELETNVPAHEIDANARLIASAPDLYEACDPDELEGIAADLIMSGWMRGPIYAERLRKLAQRARAALLRATGEA